MYEIPAAATVADYYYFFPISLFNLCINSIMGFYHDKNIELVPLVELRGGKTGEERKLI